MDYNGSVGWIAEFKLVQRRGQSTRKNLVDVWTEDPVEEEDQDEDGGGGDGEKRKETKIEDGGADDEGRTDDVMSQIEQYAQRIQSMQEETIYPPMLQRALS